MKSKKSTQSRNDAILENLSPHRTAEGEWRANKDRYPYAPLKCGEVFIRVSPVLEGKPELVRKQQEWNEKTREQRRDATRRDLIRHGRNPDTGKVSRDYIETLPVHTDKLSGQQYRLDPFDGRRYDLPSPSLPADKSRIGKDH